MDEGKLLELSAWITKAGLAGRPEIDMLEGYCERLSRRRPAARRRDRRHRYAASAL